MSEQVVEIGQYRVIKKILDEKRGLSTISAWEPVTDSTDNYGNITRFNDNIYGMITSKLSNNISSDMLSQQRSVAKELISKAFPNVNLSGAQWVKGSVIVRA